MKQWFLYAALALAWASPGGAAPACKAMVLKVSGPVIAHLYPNTSDRVITGQMWSEGLVVDVPAGSTVTVLLLNKGERVEVTGKGTLRVTPAGLVLEGCTSRPLTSAQHQLSLSGENHRQIGGVTVREGKELLDAKLDRITLTGSGMVVSCPAESGEPKNLEFVFRSYYGLPNLSPDLEKFTDLRREEAGTQIAGLVAEGKRIGSRWEWEVPWPAGNYPLDLGLSVAPLPGAEDWLYTRVHIATPEEEQQLEAAKEDALTWAQQEPTSAQPWLVYAANLEEKGHLEEANGVVDKALLLQPGDEGLIRMKARLLMDLGRYHQASLLLKANRPKTPQ